jgi:hypothetical protein
VIRQFLFRECHRTGRYDKFYLRSHIMDMTRKLKPVHTAWHVNIRKHQAD